MSRLGRLEKELRTWKRATVALAALVLVGLVMGAAGTRPKELVVRGLKLVDAEGRTRAGLANFRGGSVLGLYDAEENMRIALVVSPDGPMVTLYDAGNKARALLLSYKDGPVLQMFDAGGGMIAKLP